MVEKMMTSIDYKIEGMTNTLWCSLVALVPAGYRWWVNTTIVPGDEIKRLISVQLRAAYKQGFQDGQVRQ